MDDDIAALEARLKRGVVVRRLVIGIGALALGIAIFALGVIRQDLTVHASRPVPWRAIVLASAGLAAGDEGVVVERGSERVIAIRRRHAAMLVHLATSRYDDVAVQRIADHLATRTSLLEPFADRWKSQYGGE